MFRPTISQRLMAKNLSVFESKFEKAYSSLKRELFAPINKKSKVLEIGPGTGVNFKYYPRGLKLTVIEPNELLHANLRKNALSAGVQLKIIDGSSEKVPLKNSSFDFVVSTLVLCSVKDVNSSLNEIKRVLKNNGKFLFIEHVLDENNPVRRILQRVLSNPLWRFMGDNCHPDRKIGNTIENANFKSVQIKRFTQNGLGFFGNIIKSQIKGFAIK